MTLPGKVMNFSSCGSGALNHGSFLFYNSTYYSAWIGQMAENCDTVLVLSIHT